MYNILARVSDHYEMKGRYSINNDAGITFEGAWEPFVRDFDPTLNYNFMTCEDAPVFNRLRNLYLQHEMKILKQKYLITIARNRGWKKKEYYLKI